MRKFFSEKKGSTLVELVIVMAVASIISSMIVSYAVMFSKRVKTNNQKLSLMQDITIAQLFVENWIEDMTENGFTPTQAENDQPFGFNNGDYTISLTGGMLTAKFSNSEKSVAVSTFTSITITFLSDNNDYLYYCTLTYKHIGKETQLQDKIIFTVNPRAGESFTANGGTP